MCERIVWVHVRSGKFVACCTKKGPYNRSLFYWASYYGQEAVVKQYLTHEELKDIREEQWFQDELRSALFAACCGSSNIHGKLVKLLFEHGALLDSMDNLSNDALKEIHGVDVLGLLRLKPTLVQLQLSLDLGKLKTLNEKGLDINIALEDGYTPMHLAVRNNNDGAAWALIDLKADLDAETLNGHQPLHKAFLAGKESIIRKIHNSDHEKLKKTTMNGNRSLHGAACTDDKQIVTLVTGIESSCRGNSIYDPWPPLAEAETEISYRE